MFVATLLVFLSVFLVTAVLLWRKRHFSYFKKLGIPGPEPNLICGNLLEYHSSESYKVIGWWLKKYGNIFGFSNGDVPFVVINDLDFIEYVYVRNFGNFANRGLNMMTDLMHPILGKSLLLARGTNARNIRSCLSYALSSAKLKKMIAGFEEDADIFVKSLDPYAETGEEVHMLEKLEGLAMDYVARGSFGLEERFQGKPDHPFLTVAKKAFRGVMKGPFHWIAQSTTTLGELMRPFYWLCFTFGEFTFLDMTVHTEKIVDMRRKDPSLRRPDLLQNLIDAEYVESSNVEEDTPRPTGFFKSKTLTNDEITTTATSVVLGGFESVSTALAYIIFNIAKHEDVQERVHKEVMEAVKNSGSLDYEAVKKKLNYLEQVLNETLRLYPPGLLSVTRQAKEDFEFHGIKFKAGTCFMVPTYQLHRDPRFWPSPEIFDPDRFSPEHGTSLKKLAYAVFGIGPRNCVGMRFTILELKYTIARLVQKYHLELGASQMGTMEMDTYAFASYPGRGPWIILRRH
ncbi:cytochrome P450 3A8-like isoform X2 [Haemaphysalis longicornis]